MLNFTINMNMHIFPIPWDQGWKVTSNYNDPKGLILSYYTYMSKMASLTQKCKDMHVWWFYYINSNPCLSHKFAQFKVPRKMSNYQRIISCNFNHSRIKIDVANCLCRCIILDYNIQSTILDFFLQFATTIHVSKNLTTFIFMVS
jgi:hypothetical protein